MVKSIKKKNFLVLNLIYTINHIVIKNIKLICLKSTTCYFVFNKLLGITIPNNFFVILKRNFYSVLLRNIK